MVLIVASGLVSGNYDSAGGTSDSNALKSNICTLPSVRTSQRTLRFRLGNPVGDRSTGELQFMARFI